MSIETKWDNKEETILITKIDGKWSLDDYHEATTVINQITDNVEYDFVYILDLTYSEGPPARFMPVGKDLQNNAHPKMLKIIFVKASRLVRAMINIIRTIFPARTAKLAYTSDIEQARSMARQTLEQADTDS
jgi:hypothetical protein